MTDVVPYSVEHILNQSFDKNTEKLQMENLVYDPTANTPSPMLQPATGFSINGYDYFALVATDSVTDTITYKSGGSGGTTVATLTIVYTDSSKQTVSSITKT